VNCGQRPEAIDNVLSMKYKDGKKRASFSGVTVVRDNMVIYPSKDKWVHSGEVAACYIFE
jgi:hypothetical protein